MSILYSTPAAGQQLVEKTAVRSHLLIENKSQLQADNLGGDLFEKTVSLFDYNSRNHVSLVSILHPLFVLMAT